MINIAAFTSVGIHSIALLSGYMTLPFPSLKPLGKINESMKMHAINLVEKGFKQAGKRIYETKVTVMSLAYRMNLNDPRESPSIKIIEELVQLRAKVRVYDPPYVSSLQTCAGEFTSAVSIEDALDGAECGVFLTDHDVFKEISIETMKEITASPVIVDGEEYV